MELNICLEIQTTIQRNPKQFGDKCCSSLSFQQHAALAAFLGPAGQLHLGSPVWDDQELQQGGSPTLHQGDEQDVHPGYLQLEEHPGDVREPTEDQLGGEIPYSKLLSMVPPPKFLLWRCLSLFSGTTQGLLWTRPCCTERMRGASMDFASESLILRLGHITRYLTLTTMDASRLWTPDLYVDRVRQILGPTKVTYNSAFLWILSFDLFPVRSSTSSSRSHSGCTRIAE